MPALVLLEQPAAAEDAAPLSQPVYVTRQDCLRLVAHHPDPGVAYQAGSDVHGRTVAPADVPGSPAADLLPDRLAFDLKVNPLGYGATAATAAAPGSKTANTAATLAHIEVDLLTGSARLNGRALDDGQIGAVTEACRRAGYR